MAQPQQLSLVDNLGSTKLMYMHPTQRVVIFEQGNFILLWDLDYDKKVKLHSHEFQVQQLLFFGQDNKYLLTIDTYHKTSIFISEWESLKRIEQIYLPQKQRQLPIFNVITSCNSVNNEIYIVENEQKGGYRLSIWSFLSEQLDMLFVSETKSINQCIGIETFNSQYFSQIAVIEPNQVKYWKIQNQDAAITNKITLKENVCKSKISQQYNILFLLTDNGKLYQLNIEGDFVGSKKIDQYFTALDCFGNYLFLGTNKGNVLIMEISTGEFINEIHFQDVKKYNKINQINDNIIKQQQDKDTVLYKQQLPDIKQLNTHIISKELSVLQISVGNEGNLMSILYSDSSMAIFDFQKQGSFFSLNQHSEKVNQIIWEDESEESSKFLSIANDGNLHFQSFKIDRYVTQILDIQQAIKKLPSSSYHQSKLYLEALKPDLFDNKVIKKEMFKYKLTAIIRNYINGEYYISDNQGQLIVLDKSGQIFEVHKLCQYKIKSLSLSPIFDSNNSLYISITLCTGMTIIVDPNQNFQILLKVETHQDQESLKYKVYKNSICFQDQLDGQDQLQRGDGFLLAATQNYNSVRIHSISKQQNSLTAIGKGIFYVDGILKGFQIHPSNQYIMLMSNLGYIDVYRVQSQENRGRIEIPYFSNNLTIDHSGLYFAISYHQKYIEELQKNKPSTYNIFKEYAGSKSKSNSVSLSNRKLARNSNFAIYEFGNGNLIHQQSKLFGISHIGFSEKKGKFLQVCSQRGQIQLYEFQFEIRQNMDNMFAHKSVNQNIWEQYQINLKDFDYREIPRSKDEADRLKICEEKCELIITDVEQNYDLTKNTRNSVNQIHEQIMTLKEDENQSRFLRNQQSNIYNQSNELDRMNITHLNNNINDDINDINNDIKHNLSYQQESEIIQKQNQQQMPNYKLKEINRQTGNVNPQSIEQINIQNQQQSLTSYYPENNNNSIKQQQLSQPQFNLESDIVNFSGTVKSQFYPSQKNFRKNIISQNQSKSPSKYNSPKIQSPQHKLINIPTNSVEEQIKRAIQMKEEIRRKNFQNIGTNIQKKQQFGYQNLQYINQQQPVEKNINKNNYEQFYSLENNLNPGFQADNRYKYQNLNNENNKNIQQSYNYSQPEPETIDDKEYPQQFQNLKQQQYIQNQINNPNLQYQYKNISKQKQNGDKFINKEIILNSQTNQYGQLEKQDEPADIDEQVMNFQ